MWPIQEKEKKTAAHIVAKYYPLYLAVKMCRYGSLIYINPSGSYDISTSNTFQRKLTFYSKKIS